MNLIDALKKYVKPASHVLTVAMLAVGIGLCVQMFFTIRALNELAGLKEGMIDNLSTFGEMQTISSEIKAIYDEYGITEDIDFDKCSDMALSFFVLSTGDKYGTYSSPEEAEEKLNSREENQSGIGVKITLEDAGCYVVRVYDGSGAYNAGIKPGDYIIEADGHSVLDEDYNDFINYISGEEGTYVDIKYIRDGSEYTVSVLRGTYNTPSVTYEIIDNIAYVKIDSFTYRTNTEFKETMTNLDELGYDDFIIDLRYNLGGILDSVVDMVDFMVPSGLIVKTEDKNGNIESEWYSDEDEFDANIVVLVNDNTASASELFTQSLKDYDKATVIGETTYGKGTVVSEFELSNGGTLTISTAKYYTASGTCIEGVGVEPNIEIKFTDEQKYTYYKIPLSEDIQVQRAIEFFNTGK